MILYILYVIGHPGVTFLIVSFAVGSIANLIWRKVSRCEYCSSFFKLNWEPSCTAYAWDGVGEDPNRDVLLCKCCAEEHHAYWKDMWDDYYSSRL